MKITYTEFEKSKSDACLVAVVGSWKEMHECESWLKKSLGPKNSSGHYLIKYVRNDEEISPRDFWGGFEYHRKMEIYFTRKEDTIAFKLVFDNGDNI